MDLAVLKNYAQRARKDLQSQIDIRLGIVLQKGSLEEREQPEAIHKLKEAISESSREKVIERTAYTWFNRFVALRYIDAKQYGEIRVLSPAEGETVPEILSSAKQGLFSSGIRLDAQKKSRIQSLLNGSLFSTDPESEAYRMLLSSVCNAWSQKMPFLFEKISDYIELLLPTDLLSIDSIRARTVEALTKENCETVEVIGWLYQYYISEKKDEVFALLKKGKKISPEDIPSATQLFTPNWIVKYMVQNTLGRIWMKSHPRSKLTSIMEYYIPDSENLESLESKLPKELNLDNLFVSQKTEHLEIPNRVEELRFCDPACGSGHILVYAFELFYAIYIEEGYMDSEIPELILKNNLFGIEIDIRAGELASLALSLKAREKHREYFQSPTKPNILIFENIHLEKAETQSYQDFLGEKALSKEILSLLGEFKEAKHFGSLIRPSTTNVKSLRESLETLEISDLYILKTHKAVLQALRQAEYLHQSYHIVVANPPYMGGKGMNDGMKKYVAKHFPDSKSDLFSAFTERLFGLVCPEGEIGLMTPFTWMFISSFEKLRNLIINENTVTSLIRPEYHAFFESAFVPICSFTLRKRIDPNHKGTFVDLQSFYGADIQPIKLREAIQNPDCGYLFKASAIDLQKIPGSPIAFWVSDRVRDVFKSTSLELIGSFKRGIATGDNNYFLRFWFETNLQATSIITNSSKWKKYNKGGEYRKYYGNQDYVINWYNDGFEIKNFLDDKGKLRSRPQNIEYNYQNSISYSSISSGTPSIRYYSGFINDQSGNFINLEWNKLLILIGLLNSKIILTLLNLLNPTLNLLTSDFDKLPIKLETNTIYTNDLLINFSKLDWDSNETSWDFTGLPLLRSTEVWDLKKLFPEESLLQEDAEEIPLLSPSFPDPSFPKPLDLENTYHKLNSFWKEMISETKRFEEENNRIFIEAYGLQEELTPEVPIHEITLTCNPHYRYDKDKSSSELERLLLQDTIREFLSYSVGCMFGRYSLDKEGLILANQGESLEDYLQKIGRTKENATFLPDEDNVIPILDEDWFSDDITGRFREFLEKTFGKENFQKNLNFIESALGTPERPKKIRDYFLKDFTNDHTKRYKKRPIYWLFQSPKGSFQALIYMHRYRTEIVGILLSNYVREYINKLEFKITSLTEVQNSKTASTSEKSRALRELPKLKLSLEELKLYERELYEIASKRLAIDLDDGVKVNYLKFGKILKTIKGLDAKEED